MQFRKKPAVIDAIQNLGVKSWPNVYDFIAASASDMEKYALSPSGKLEIETLEGVMTADVNDWIIKGVKGELYPCKPDIFEQTYELVT